MNQHLETLTDAELFRTVGGDWNWSDFTAGLGWAFGVGCYLSLNPFLCGAALVFTGFSLLF